MFTQANLENAILKKKTDVKENKVYPTLTDFDKIGVDVKQIVIHAILKENRSGFKNCHCRSQ